MVQKLGLDMPVLVKINAAALDEKLSLVWSLGRKTWMWRYVR